MTKNDNTFGHILRACMLGSALGIALLLSDIRGTGFHLLFAGAAVLRITSFVCTRIRKARHE